MKKKIQRYFHGPEGYNCAQTVLKIFQEHKSVAEKALDEFSAHGGGRAPEGYCGALHAALHLTDKSCHEDIKNAFWEQAGALTCRQIRSLGKITCRECIEIAANQILGRSK